MYRLFTSSTRILFIGMLIIILMLFLAAGVSAFMLLYNSDLHLVAAFIGSIFCFTMYILYKMLESFQYSWDKTHRQLLNKSLETRLLFNTISDPILVLNKEHNIVDANHAAQSVFGADKIGEAIENIISEPKFSAMLNSTIADDKSREVDILLHMKDDLYFKVKLASSGMINEDYEDGSNYILLVFQDITESRRNEEMFSDFIANASHEIKTPLTSIIGMTETILAHYRNDPAVVDEFMPMILTQSIRLKNLLRDLLNLASIRDKVEVFPEGEASLQEIFNEVSVLLKWELCQGGNNFVLDGIDDASKIILHGDKSQLIQVFCNLVTNAIKYGKAETDIIALYSLVSADGDAFVSNGKAYHKISIIDQGDGIEEKHLKRLSERFYRVDKSRSRKIGGTGLGLAIVNQILLRHKALLRMESKLNQGSIFSVYLPIEN